MKYNYVCDECLKDYHNKPSKIEVTEKCQICKTRQMCYLIKESLLPKSKIKEDCPESLFVLYGDNGMFVFDNDNKKITETIEYIRKDLVVMVQDNDEVERRKKELECRKRTVTAFFKNKFVEFLPISAYDDKIKIKDNEIGVLFNCSIIFNPEFIDWEE